MNVKGNEFGTFLGALNQESRAATLSPNQASNDTLLGYLVANDHPTPIANLVAQTTIPFSSLASALETLKSAHLVAVTAKGNDEVVELTDIGRQVAKLGLGASSRAA